MKARLCCHEFRTAFRKIIRPRLDRQDPICKIATSGDFVFVQETKQKGKTKDESQLLQFLT
jgi:hypothetical protein